MMTTKEQERQAIAKIKKIVESMGGNSYLASAMEGVLETAEMNIEDDAAYSLKGRAEIAEETASALKKENEELRKKVQETEERAEKFKANCEAMYSELQRRTIPEWMVKELEKTVETGLARTDREIKEAADGMAAAIGEDGRAAKQAAEQAKWYKEQRSEQYTLNRMKDFIMRYKGNEQE